MRLYDWEVNNDLGYTLREIATIEELWELVTKKTDPVQAGHILELSAATALDGEQFLVLNWVPTEE